MTREEEIKARVEHSGVTYLSLPFDRPHACSDILYLLARNEELCGDLEWHKRELAERVDEIYWLADDKIDLRNEIDALKQRVNHLESALGGIKEEAAAFASDERDLGYIFIGIYTCATNALGVKEVGA